MAGRKKTETVETTVNAEELQTPAENPETGNEKTEKKKTTKKTKPEDTASPDPDEKTNEEEFVEESKEEEETSLEEDLENDDELAQVAKILMEAFRSKRVNRMTSEQRYERNKQYEMADDSYFAKKEHRAENRVDRLKQEFQELASAADKRRKVLKWVTVNGWAQDDKYGYVFIAKLQNKKKPEFTIKIPTSEFMLFNMSDYESEDGVITQKGLQTFERNLDRFLGVDVQVLIYSVDEESETALASRLAASDKLAQRYFRDESKKGKTGLSEGSIATGVILATKRDKVIVSVHGQDVVIKSDETSWNMQRPLDEEFERGQIVNVKLLSVEPSYKTTVNGNVYNLAKCTGSIRQATENPFEEYIGKYEIDGRYVAVPKRPTSTGKWVCTIDGVIDVECTTPAAWVVETRGKCIVKITEINEKYQKVYGIITVPSI